MFTDTHCHIYKEYYQDIDKIINNALNVNISQVINNGCDNKSNIEVLNLISKYPNMYGALGIHPENAGSYKLEDLTFIKNNLNNNKIIAIGEIGLDYHYENVNKEKQIKLFEEQLKIAEEYNMPVIIHSREATLDTINILKKYKVTGVIHSFSGSLETAKIYLKMGFSFGINGVITFKNAKIKDVIKELPLSSILLETDSPYLTPTPLRGTTNEPANIKYIAEFVANLKNININDLSKITNENIKRIFDI